MKLRQCQVGDTTVATSGVKYQLGKVTGSSGFGTFVFLCSSIVLIVITFPVSIWSCFQVVKEYERAIVFRLGRLRHGQRAPGLIFFIPCIDLVVKVDVRTVSFDVPSQKASLTVSVDAVVYYRIFEPMMSVVNIENASKSTHLLSQTMLRNFLGKKTLSEILTDRDHITEAMQKALDVGTEPWGVKVERIEIKDVRLPPQMQRAMAAEAEATREARAKVIAAEGEHNASRALKDAADVISGSPSALQLRYLQTLTQISAEKNSTIIFPLPIDMMLEIRGQKE
ncbi:Erythrocyte band 7 integral membrane protein [Lamellibrachia satsuma]|nr:Erythrocyte band 7 integral membrane protein [Lamellibrachia satsuma]